MIIYVFGANMYIHIVFKTLNINLIINMTFNINIYIFEANKQILVQIFML